MTNEVRTVQVMAINKFHGTAMMDDGSWIPIVLYINKRGEDCDGPEGAALLVAGPDRAGKWHVEKISDFTWATVH